MNRLRRLLRSRIFGIPAPIVIVAVAALAYWWYMGGFGTAVSEDDAAADDAMDPNEGLSSTDTGLLEAPASVVNETHYHTHAGNVRRKRRQCPRGYVRVGGRCVKRKRRQIRRTATRYAATGGRGTARVGTAGRKIAARR